MQRQRHLEQPRQISRNGQAIGIAGLFASLIVGALLLILFVPIIEPILARANERATDPTIVEGNLWLSQILDNMPFIFAGISFFGLIVLAVYQSKLA